MEIPAADLKIEVWPGHGTGQHVGTTSGVRATHLPTGIQAILDVDRSLHRTKAVAMVMFDAALKAAGRLK